MSAEIILVTVMLPGDFSQEGTFTLSEEIASGPDGVRLEIAFGKRQEFAEARDFFEALVQLRRKLEPENISILCNGAMKNVYPSPMARSMGMGIKAYKLTLGKQAKTEDLVHIFESTLALPVASVQSQEAFYQEWLKSLKML